MFVQARWLPSIFQKEREKSEKWDKIRGKRRKVSLVWVPVASCVVDVFLVVGVHPQFMVLPFISEFHLISHRGMVGRGGPIAGWITCHLCDRTGILGPQFSWVILGASAHSVVVVSMASIPKCSSKPLVHLCLYMLSCEGGNNCLDSAQV